MYGPYMEKSDDEAQARLFWTGGSQAVRLPKAMRMPGSEVRVRKVGKTLVLEPVADVEGWDGFWNELVPLKTPVKRWPTKGVERRRKL